MLAEGFRDYLGELLGGYFCTFGEVFEVCRGVDEYGCEVFEFFAFCIGELVVGGVGLFEGVEFVLESLVHCSAVFIGEISVVAGELPFENGFPHLICVSEWECLGECEPVVEVVDLWVLVLWFHVFLCVLGVF